MSTLTVFVEGFPVTQGSMISNGAGRGMRHSNQAKLRPWRYNIISMLNRHCPADWDPSAPLTVCAVFRFSRPQGHFGTGKNANKLKASAPDWHITKPDLDKLQRSIGDAIEQSGLARGDQQITSWSVTKRWCVDREVPGVLLTLISLPEG